MSWRNILTIYGKELRDMLRDRRTILSMIVIPTFVMPGIIALVVFVSVKVVKDAAASAPTIVVIGGEDSPKVKAVLQRGKMNIIPATGNWKQHISEKKLRAAVEIPAGFDQTLQRGESANVTVYNYAGELRSDMAVSEVRRILTEYGNTVVADRLSARGLSPAAIRPLTVTPQNVAPPEKVGGNVIGGIIPYFFLLLSFTGAMYPAMDLTAGEKERGTMETILCAPIARLDLVLGKFLMILTASLGTVACSLASMTLTFTVGGTFFAQRLGGSQKAAEKIAMMTTIDPVGVFAVVGLVLPMVVLFSAGLFTISLFAKSFKEAQSYVSPLIILIILPAVVGMLPGVELDAKLAFIPILNVSLASKELISGVWHWPYLALIFGSTCIYAAIALALAVKMFNREDVIFRT